MLSSNDSNGNAVVLSTTTDADGRCRFDGLRSETYTIYFQSVPIGGRGRASREHVPAAMTCLIPDGDSVTRKTDPILLGIDSQDFGWDRGVVTETTTVPPTTSVLIVVPPIFPKPSDDLVEREGNR